VSKTTMTAAFAALLAASAPIAYAQTTTVPSHSATAVEHGLTTQSRVMPGQIRMTDMNGATIYGAGDKSIGDIKDVVLDRDGRVAEVVLNVGATLGMGGKLVAIPMNDIKIATDSNNKPRFTVDMTEAQLKSAQAFSLTAPSERTGSSTAPATTPTTRRD